MTDLPESSSEKNEQTKDSLEHIVPASNKVEPKTIRKIENPSERADELYSDLFLLKAKCSHYEETLREILLYPITDQCRDLVHNALASGFSDFNKK